MAANRKVLMLEPDVHRALTEKARKEGRIIWVLADRLLRKALGMENGK